MENKKLSRRQFMGKTMAGVGAVTVLAGCNTKISRWRFFTEPEAKVVELITEQIIPADEDPGAIDAGVVNFIDKQLVGPYERFQQDYRNGLRGVQATSQSMYGKPFENLPWDDQTAVLKAMESGEVNKDSWPEISARQFFGMVRNHSLQGFYGSPRHGGNKDYVSYRMLELDYPYIIGQNRYKNS